MGGLVGAAACVQKVYERREQARTMLAVASPFLSWRPAEVAQGNRQRRDLVPAESSSLERSIGPAAAIHALASNTAGEISEELSATLSGRACQEVIDIFRDGSLKKRCDFAFVAGFGSAGGAPPLAPEYDPGMYDALRLLRADSVRSLRAGDASSAADRLATTFQWSGTWARSAPACAIAHCDFNAALSIIETAFRASQRH
jgi:hypothetical protein